MDSIFETFPTADITRELTHTLILNENETLILQDIQRKLEELKGSFANKLYYDKYSDNIQRFLISLGYNVSVDGSQRDGYYLVIKW